MAIRERDYVTELESLKTSIWGYDREAVIAYIRDLIGKADEEKQQSLRELSEQNLALAAENAALKSEIQTRKQVYAELVKRVDQLNLSMDASMHKIGNYAQESARTLEDYRRREQEVAAKEAAAEEKRAKILQEAKEEAARIKATAETEAETIRMHAKESEQRVLKETQGRIDAILAEAKSKAQKGRTQYAYDRQCLRDYCDHLRAYLVEIEVKTGESQQAAERETVKAQESTRQAAPPNADAVQISKQAEEPEGKARQTLHQVVQTKMHAGEEAQSETEQL